MIDIKVVSGNPNERDRESRAFHFSGSYSYLEMHNDRKVYKVIFKLKMPLTFL